MDDTNVLKSNEPEEDRLEVTCNNTRVFLGQFFTMMGVALALVAALFFTGLFRMEVVLILLGFFAVGTVAGILSVRNSTWTILFRGKEIILKDGKFFRHFNFWDVPQCGIKLKQSKYQKKRNLGQMKILGTGLVFHDVKDYDKVVLYIEEHFRP